MKAAQAVALRGLRPVLGWDELPAACFGVIYRAAIYIASISAAVWGPCEEARGEGSSLPPPRARPLQGGMLLTALGPAWLGVEPGMAQGLLLLQPSGHPLVEKTLLGSQDFLELALPVLAENKV